MILLIHTSVCKFIHCHSSLALRKWISSGSPEASWSRWASRCCPSEFLPECQSFSNSLAPSLLLSSYSDPFFLPHFPLFPTLAALWRPHFIEKQKKTISQNKTVSPAIFLNLSRSSLTPLPVTVKIWTLEPLKSGEKTLSFLDSQT